jgi:UPF0755 protein
MGRVSRLIIGLLIVTALAITGGWTYYERQVARPINATDTEKSIFKVPKGASLLAVGKKLKNEGFIRDVLFWRIYLKRSQSHGVKAGRHEISKAMNIPQLLEALASVPLSEDVPLTMIEGWRIKDADQWLSANGWIKAGNYIKAASNPKQFKLPFPFSGATLEGYLLPETYRVNKGQLNVHKFVQRQIDAFNLRFYQSYKQELNASKRDLPQIVILASMLEREEPKPEVRPMVADVMYKRLDAKTPLGIDATSRYLLEDWTDRRKFLAQLRNRNDPYNTRLKIGLPPTAIGAPGLESLISALRPKANPYWYYLHDAQQNIHFGKNAAEHEANRKKYNVY